LDVDELAVAIDAHADGTEDITDTDREPDSANDRRIREVMASMNRVLEDGPSDDFASVSSLANP